MKNEILAEILEISKKLISFKTTKDNDGETVKCFDYIKNYFDPLIESGKIIANNYQKKGVSSVVFSNTDTLTPEIVLNGHIDVVDAKTELFIPKIKDSRLYGRGAADMKSEIAAMMICFKEAINKNIKNSIALMITSDEEEGGESGVGYLVNEIGYRSKVTIIPDGGHNFELVTKEKGDFWIKIISQGKSSHGSRPWLGENAIVNLLNFYQELEKIFPPLPRTESLYQEGISINLGKISGGTDINTVPDKAEMYLDIRYSDKSDKDRIIEALKLLTENFTEKEYKLNFEISRVIEILETNPENCYLKKFKNIAEEILCQSVKITKVSGASDARFFSAKNIPVIIMVPDCGNAHSDNEWVDLKSLEKFYLILIEFIKKSEALCNTAIFD